VSGGRKGDLPTAVARCEGLAGAICTATGRVVVDDLIGEGAAHKRAGVGDTPNLAAHL
jgi:hypothetical protein